MKYYRIGVILIVASLLISYTFQIRQCIHHQSDKKARKTELYIKEMKNILLIFSVVVFSQNKSACIHVL